MSEKPAPLTLAEYQAAAMRTAVYPDRGNNLAYAALGLAGEAGEVANKVKKIIRGDGPLDASRQMGIAKELGGVLWYVAACSYEIGYPFHLLAPIGGPATTFADLQGIAGVHGEGLPLAALGLSKWAGEVADKVESLTVFRHDIRVWAADIATALGAVLAQVAACCREIGIAMEQVARMNLFQLEGRQAAGTIKGDGDNR